MDRLLLKHVVELIKLDKFDDIEKLIQARIISLEDLSEEQFELFRTWIES